MKGRKILKIAFLVLVVLVVALWLAPVHAQAPTGTLRGQVTDPSSAAISGDTKLLTTPAGASLDTTTNKEGFYEFKGLLPGEYTLKGVVPGFALLTKDSINIKAGQPQQLNLSLSIQVQKEEVQVSDSTTKLGIDSSSNAGSIVLKGQDLEALSDDPDELQSELQALAGPSAGPNGGEIYIDGFTGGQLPPKASIREIRVNQNPFSAEYDKLGYGRIEIFTKPGTDQFHGQLSLTGNTAALNSRNPFEIISPGTQPPGYDSTQFSANVGGPLSKKASFFFNIESRNLHELSVVSAKILDPNLHVISFSEAVPNPRTRLNLSPRFDYQLGSNNTITARYQYERADENNNGIGQFNLTSRGFNQFNREHQFQVSDTQILNAKTINETRFRFVREVSQRTPQSIDPAVAVQGAFTSGGNSEGQTVDTLDRYELQNQTSMSLTKHFVKFGVRLRANGDLNVARSNFNGTFTFGLRQDPNCPPNSSRAACPAITGLEAYQKTLQGLAQGLNMETLMARGGAASQYSITVGSASAALTYFDAGVYAQDDWRLKRNLTLSYGLRFETQNGLKDHADFATRLGFAWAIGGAKNAARKTILRAGYGIFYDRFSYDLALQQQRLNGLTQQQYVVNGPNFFLSDTPAPGQLPTATTAPPMYRRNPELRTPYTMQIGISLERQLTGNANLAVTYLNSRGVHQFFTENINPPICSILPCDPSTAPRPLNSPANIYEYESEGTFKQNQLILNTSVRMGSKLSLFGYYTLNYANADTAGASSFPSIANKIALDYGRAAFDVRHRLFLGGTIGLPLDFRLSPFLIASSGMPFNITTGQDINGDSIFNDRPAFANSRSIPSNVVTNRYGSFNLLPQPGETVVPINYLTSGGMFSLNLRVSKTFGFGKRKENTKASDGAGPEAGGTFGRAPGGPRGGGGFGGRGMGGPEGNTTSRRYSLTLSVSGRNIFNNVNLGTPIGNLSSPLFGQSNGLAGPPYSSATANRRIDLQVMFNF